MEKRMTPCPCGSTEVKRYPHRTGGNTAGCLNGMDKSVHVCAATCSYLGMFCTRCRLVRTTGIRMCNGFEMGV